MTQFTSSAKPIQYFCETTLINKLARAVGDRLERLTQSERYQLLTCLSSWCHAYCELVEDEEPETLLEHYYSSVTLEYSGNVLACLALLEHEDVDNIAAMLPAIAEYARNEDVEVEDANGEEVEEEIHGAEVLLSSLNEFYV